MYKRILLKLSGAALHSKQKNGLIIDNQKVSDLAAQVAELVNRKIQVGIVIGGGNILRGASAAKLGIERAQADYMGMLATVINGIALQTAFVKHNITTRLMSAIPMDKVAEPYIRQRALRHLEKGYVVIFSGGTGHPFFTTDSAAALRAAEVNADVILMGKNNVNGVYDADPIKYPNAKHLPFLTFREAFEKNIKIMDLTATTICMENNIDILVFNINKQNNIINTLTKPNDKERTIISNKK